jgi:prepilin-type N-terminal cleavage/methylation domain-containing protein
MGETERRDKGFTLIEIVFVLAIIVVLASLIMPVSFSRLRDAELVRANADVKAIAVALISFDSDLGHFPACDGNSCNPLNSGNQTLRFLAFGNGMGDIRDTFPPDDPGLVNKWNLTSPINLSVIPARNNGMNHLGRNDPNADNIASSTIAGSKDYTEGNNGSDLKRWKGPYLANVSSDPWGHPYIAHVGAMEKNGIPVVIVSLVPFLKPQGWILSAGPDGIFQTSPTDTVLAGDDIGFILFTKKPG